MKLKENYLGRKSGSVIMGHLKPGPFEAALEVEALINFGTVKDALEKRLMSALRPKSF
jgi:hypothetical protein